MLHHSERMVRYSAHTPDDELCYLRSLLLNERYDEIRVACRRFNASAPADIELIIASADSALKWNDRPTPYLINWLMSTPTIEAAGASFSLFNPMNFGANLSRASEQANINTKGSDWGLVALSDGSFIYSSDGREVQSAFDGDLSSSEAMREAYLYRSKDEADVTPLFDASEKFVGEKNVGAPTFSTDEMEMFYAAIHAEASKHWNFRALFSMRERVPNRLGIYSRKRSDSKAKWGKPTPFTFNREALYSVLDPCLSPDGHYLYFASDMPNGSGTLKIFRSRRNADGSFAAPEQLGNGVNHGEKYSSRFPRFDPVGNFYFSTDGLSGLGGLDIFRVSVQDGAWGEPRNMGVPFNSSGDDFAPSFVSESRGFLSSNRLGGRGGDDIYSFDLNPAPITFQLMEEEPEMQPEELLGIATVVRGKPYALRNVRFENAKWAVHRDMAMELGILAALLSKYPKMVIEIGVHTDSRNPRKYNVMMSQLRAQTIKNFMEERFGIAAGRIVPKGYGDTQPQSPCGNWLRKCTEEDNKANMRTEFMVIKK
jgi:outer membrane protein OmpA-like peptidoglycan-associated protein